jgi:hypothetical protein
VPRKFFDKPEAENRPLGRVMKNVKANQSIIEVLVCSILLHSFWHMPPFVIEIRHIDIERVCQGAMLVLGHCCQ